MFSNQQYQNIYQQKLHSFTPGTQPEDSEHLPLWSWYILNLALGEYETINKDLLQLRQLDQFIMRFNSECFNDVCTLFVVPWSKVQDGGLAKGSYFWNLLRNYYTNSNNISTSEEEEAENELQNLIDQLQITPIGLITEDQVILMVKDPTRQSQSLELKGGVPLSLQHQGSANFRNSFTTDRMINDSNSVLSGETGLTPSVVELDMDLLNNKKEQEQEQQSSPPNQRTNSETNSISVFSPCSFSTGDSISAINSDDEDGSDVDSGNSRLGVSLTRMVSISNGSTFFPESEDEGDKSDYPSVCDTEDDHITLPFPSKIVVNEGDQASNIGLENDEINLSIIIFKNLQNNTKKVAIRQLSETNEFTSDWILYDDEFNFKNLQLLSLSEILEWGSMSTKILIYSNLNYGKILQPTKNLSNIPTTESSSSTPLNVDFRSLETTSFPCNNNAIRDEESDAQSLDSEINVDENDLTVMEFDGGSLLNRPTYTTTHTSTFSSNSYSDSTFSNNNTIKFVKSSSSRANSIATQPTSVMDFELDLSRSETREQIRSIKSELNLSSNINIGSNYSNSCNGNGNGTGTNVISKTKSTPNSSNNSANAKGKPHGDRHRFSIGKRFKGYNGNEIVKIKSNISQVGKNGEDQKCCIM